MRRSATTRPDNTGGMRRSATTPLPPNISDITASDVSEISAVCCPEHGDGDGGGGMDGMMCMHDDDDQTTQVACGGVQYTTKIGGGGLNSTEPKLKCYSGFNSNQNCISGTVPCHGVNILHTQPIHPLMTQAFASGCIPYSTLCSPQGFPHL